MFTLSIAVGRAQPMVWTLMFRTQKAANDAVAVLRTSMGEISITDEFGQTFDGTKADIVASMFENLEESRQAHIERTLEVEKVKAGTISRMRGNPAFSSLATPGPAMLAPGMINGRMS